MTTFKQAFTLTTVALLFSLGCESAADQQRRADEAQADANEKAARAQVEAARTARDAQAKADRTFADAQEDFSKMREDFRHDIEVKLVEVDKEIAELRTQATTEQGKAKEK